MGDVEQCAPSRVCEISQKRQLVKTWVGGTLVYIPIRPCEGGP